MGTMNVTKTHSGIETEEVLYEVVLGEPWDYQEPPFRPGAKPGTLWRIESLYVRHSRDRKYGEPWGAWSVTCKHRKATNVLKSGKLGQRDPGTYGSLLVDHWARTGDVEPLDWCADRLVPILEAAAAYRDEVARRD